MRVLYVDHTGRISGAERSLLTLLEALPADLEALLAAPHGPLTERAVGLGVRTFAIAGTEASLRVSSPATAGAVLDMARSAGQIARLARARGVDVIHANSIRAAMSAVPAGRLVGRPVVAHIRDALPPSPVSRASLRLIATGARTVVGNSAFTSAVFTEATGRKDVVTLFNPIDVDGIEAQRIPRAAARALVDLPADALVVAVVGQITPWKGQEEALRAAALLAERGRPVHVLIIGEAKFLEATTRYDNRAYVEGLERLAAGPALAGRVRFLGEREDVVALLCATDALLVPSWEEPFGRVVVEGMAAGVPVIATNEGGPAELIADGETGLLVPSRDPSALADALERLAGDAALRVRLIGQASVAARRFRPDEHVAALLDLYREAG